MWAQVKVFIIWLQAISRHIALKPVPIACFAILMCIQRPPHFLVTGIYFCRKEIDMPVFALENSKCGSCILGKKTFNLVHKTIKTEQLRLMEYFENYCTFLDIFFFDKKIIPNLDRRLITFLALYTCMPPRKIMKAIFCSTRTSYRQRP